MNSPYKLDRLSPLTKPQLADLQRKRFLFDGVFTTDYSLAIVNRNLARSLLQFDIDLTLHSDEPNVLSDPMLKEMPLVRSRFTTSYPEHDIFDVHLRNTWPPKASDMVGRVNAYVCFAWEEMEFPPLWVDEFNNHLQLVMVISNFVATSLRHSGVTVPVEVVGDGCDHIGQSRLLDTPNSVATVSRSTFVHVSSCFPRKGAELLVKTFAAEFKRSDPVELIVKSFPNPHNTIEHTIEEVRRAFPDAAPITLILGSLDQDELTNMLQRATALVAPSRGEGFGLPLAEAMMLGVPVVTTAYGGQLDFCRPSTAWLVDYTLAKSTAHVTGSIGVWAEPDKQSLAAQLRAVLAYPEEARRKSDLAMSTLRKYFKWSDVAERTLKALAALGSSPKGLPQSGPTIDLVSTWNQSCGIATYSAHLFSTDLFRSNLKTVFAREIAADAVSPRDHKPSPTPIVQRPWSFDSEGARRLASCIRHGRSDVLWFQHHPGFFSSSDMDMFVAASESAGYKVSAITLHNIRDTLRNPSSWLKAFDLIFVHTPTDAQLLSEAGHFNVRVVPHGIFVGTKPPLAEGDRPFTFATFGFLQSHKNIPILLKAFALARQVVPDIRLKVLTCVQSNEDSHRERWKVEHLVDRLGLSASVILDFSFRDEDAVINALHNSDLLCFLYAGSNESATGAARIALAADRPILCSSSSVLTDIHPFSHVVQSLEIERVAEALVVLTEHTALRCAYDERRRQVVKWYNFERIASRYLADLQCCLESSPQ